MGIQVFVDGEMDPRWGWTCQSMLQLRLGV